MIQFYNQIISKKGFVDLHIHTDDSYGDEMDKMQLTPEDLLESFYTYSINNNDAPVTFAIADHNSIDGVKKVDLLIKSNPEKYKNMKFISGCEFSCSAGSLGTYQNNEGFTKNIIKNFHMLAYGFNPFNDEINFLCKLHSTRKDNSLFYCKTTDKGEEKKLKISAGAYVLSLKNIMKDYGYDYPIKEFKDVNLKTRNLDHITYINYLMNYIKKFNLPKKVAKDIEFQLKNRNVMNLGRLDCMEVMDIVENAGGYCVLAHPYLLTISTELGKNKVKSREKIEKILKEHNIKFSPNENLDTLLITYVTHYLKNESRNIYTNKKLNGIVGMEILHTTGTKKIKNLKNLTNIASANNLYLTVGGDSHGALIKNSIPSNFIKQKCLNVNNKNNLVVTDNLFANLILSNNLKNQPNCYKSFDEQFKIVKTDTFDYSETNFSYFDILNLIASHDKDFIKNNHKKQDKIKKKEQKKKLNKVEKSLRLIIQELKGAIKILNNLLVSDLSNNSAQQQFNHQKILRSDIKRNIKIISKNVNYVKNSPYFDLLNELIKEYNQLNDKFNLKYPFIKCSNIFISKNNNDERNESI